MFAFIGKNGLPASRDPETGQPSAMNLLSDARQPTLGTQAVEAAVTHLQFDGKLDDERLGRIVDFERQIYVAQSRHATAGDLMEPNGPPGLGVRNLSPRAVTACSATTSPTSSFRWVTSGSNCRRRKMRKMQLATACANPSRAVTTCSCSARSGSATRCI